MKSRLMQIILLAGLFSCNKNFDSFETPVPQTNLPNPSFFVSSDTIVETEEIADGGRYIFRSYWLTSTSPVKEGNSVTIKMNTKNVVRGAVIAYTITGIDSNDITSGKLTGNFIIGSNGTDSVTYILKADNKTEGTETMKTSSKGASLLVSISDSSQTPAAPPVTPVLTSANFIVDTIPYGDMDLLAPGRGANMFYDKQLINIPDASKSIISYDRDVRYSWWQLQKTANAGDYDWSTIDSDFKACISQGQKISFRVMTLDTDATSWSSTTYGGAKLTYPVYVHNAMQAEAAKDWTYGGSWIPNWNSSAYLSAWQNFCKALADHISNTSYNGVPFKNVVFRVDLSGFGNYGEFHSYPFINSYPSSAQKLTDASYKSIIDAQTSAFPDYPLIGNINMFVGEMSAYQGWYSLTTGNAWGKIGIRNDHFGWITTFNNDIQNNTRSYNGLNFKSEILNRWKYAPICGEPMNDAAAVTNGGSCAFWNLENEVRTYHASQFSNQNGTGVSTSCLTDNYRIASKASGYRLALKGGTISGSTVTLNWINTGIAPVYENWDVYLEVKSGTTVVWSGMTSFKPKFFQPGTTTVTATLGTIAPGSYSLYVIVKDPMGYRKPLPLANTNRQADGSYKVADIKM